MRKRYKRYLVATIIGMTIGGSTYLMTKKKQNRVRALDMVLSGGFGSIHELNF